MGYKLLKGNNIFGNKNEYFAIYKNIDGLESSSPVRINGLTVGNVTKIFHPNNNGDIIVHSQSTIKYVFLLIQLLS